MRESGFVPRGIWDDFRKGGGLLSSRDLPRWHTPARRTSLSTSIHGERVAPAGMSGRAVALSTSRAACGLPRTRHQPQEPQRARVWRRKALGATALADVFVWAQKPIPNPDPGEQHAA